MKNILLTLTMVLSFALYTTQIHAAPAVGSGFTYQGELLDNGSPANGNYDVKIALFLALAGGSEVTSLTFTNVPVSNGLFTIDDVDFGDAVYADNNQFYLEIYVRPNGGGSFTTLTPRQPLQAVPYAVQAEFLAPGGASTGDVLQFDGSDWVAAALSGTSPWNQSGSTLTSPGKVGIGEPTPSAQLHITNNTSQITLLKLDDSSTTRMIVQATGRVGIGDSVNPSDRLHVNSSVGEDALRVQVGGLTKLRVRSNGGTALGANFTAVPNNGLYVQGDVKQNENSLGLVKYMIRANCSPGPSIVQSYNGTNVVGAITITRASVGDCSISVPSANISLNYVSVSPRTTVVGSGRIVTCLPFLGGLVCKVTNESGVDVDGEFDVLVF